MNQLRQVRSRKSGWLRFVDVTGIAIVMMLVVLMPPSEGSRSVLAAPAGLQEQVDIRVEAVGSVPDTAQAIGADQLVPILAGQLASICVSYSTAEQPFIDAAGQYMLRHEVYAGTLILEVHESAAGGGIQSGAHSMSCQSFAIPFNATELVTSVLPESPVAEAAPADNVRRSPIMLPNGFINPDNSPQGGPDLVPARAQVVDGACVPGRNRLESAVRNFGGARARDILVRLYVDDVERDDVRISELDGGEEKRVRFERFELGVGSHSTRVVVDPDNAVAEVNELNNEASWEVICLPPRADILVEEIELPDRGCTLVNGRVNVTIKNAGAARAELFYVELSIDGNRRGSEEVERLDPGENKRIRFDAIEMPAGQHTLRAYVGSVDNDANEANNERSVTVTCDSPVHDLVLQSIEVEGESPCVPGRHRIEVMVRNVGDERAEDVNVTLRVDGLIRGLDAFINLGRGDDRTVRFNDIELTAGQHQIEASVVSDFSNLEPDQANNRRTIAVTCVAQFPDLQVESVEIDRGDCDPGRNKVNVRVRNSGNARAEDVVVRLQVGNATVGTENVNNLGPGDDKRVEFGNVTMSSGQQQLRARVDPNNAIQESNENNNERSVTVSCVQE